MNAFGKSGTVSKKVAEESPGVAPSTEAKAITHSLFAFVDLKDPFAPGEIAGEDLPGPILSILSAKPFDSVFLIYTLQTRGNASATEAEIARRHPGCRVQSQQLPVSNPKDYSSIMGALWRYGRDLLRQSDTNENYVCVSSGTAEMRAVWFLLTTLGIVKAKLLQVGTPAQPLFGKVNVRELRLDTADWQTILDLALPAQSFRRRPGELVTEPLAGGLLRRKGRAKKSEEVRADEKPKSGQEVFEEAFLERMRMKYGDLETKRRLPNLRRLLEIGYLQMQDFPPDRELSHEKLRDLGREFFGRYEQDLRRLPESQRLGVWPWKSVPREVLWGERGSLATDEQVSRKAQGVSRDFEFKPRPSAVPPRTKEPLRDEDGAPAKEPLSKGVPAEAEEEMASEIEPEVPEAQNKALEEAPPDTEYDPQRIDLGEASRMESFTSHEADAQFLRDTLRVPGLDDGLQELGIYVGSAVLRDAAERAGIAAESHLPVLLLGETGTGKERFAHLIHRISPRRLSDLVAINCAAIPESLAEDYLFGHMRGAFSGANGDKKGMFESADHSTLFLDEIAELTLEVQAKLLRVIQDNVIQRLGSTAPRKVDVRVIAASNRDLRNEVSAGRFREDLYFRLEVVQIKLPALRERRSEIPELALTLLKQINLRRRRPRQLTSGALMRLERYDWPGNVRQLSNVLERSVLYARGDAIQAEDLLIGEDPREKDPFASLPEPCQGFRIEEYLAQAREQLFVRALELCKGNQTEAAELLGVSKQAVSKFVAGQNDKLD